MKDLEKIIEQILPIDKDKVQEGQCYCDQLGKPPGSLGKLETIYARLYAMFSGPIDLDKKIVLVYVADNGIVAEGVSANPQETTYTVARNILAGKSGLCAISKHAGSDICLVDIGCKKDIFEGNKDKVCHGTRNMLEEPAMTREQAIAAILVGYKKTEALIRDGYRLFGTGEMGIGNTTTSSTILKVLTDLSLDEIVGYGSGIDDKTLEHKKNVVKKAVEEAKKGAIKP